MSPFALTLNSARFAGWSRLSRFLQAQIDCVMGFALEWGFRSICHYGFVAQFFILLRFLLLLGGLRRSQGLGVAEEVRRSGQKLVLKHII